MARGGEGGTLPACANFTLTGARQLSGCLTEAVNGSVRGRCVPASLPTLLACRRKTPCAPGKHMDACPVLPAAAASPCAGPELLR